MSAYVCTCVWKRNGRLNAAEREPSMDGYPIVQSRVLLPLGTVYPEQMINPRGEKGGGGSKNDNDVLIPWE